MTWREMLDALKKAQADGDQTTPRVIYPQADEQKVRIPRRKPHWLPWRLEKDA